LADAQKAGLQILVHPVVCVNISDHFTRASLRVETAKAVRVYGILLGKQIGRKVEVCYSSEMIIDQENIIESEYMTTRLEQYNRVYQGNVILGWYIASQGGLLPGDADLHRQMESFVVETVPFLLLLNPSPQAGKARELPIAIFESSVKVTAKGPEVTWKPLPFGIETSEVERIALDRVATVARSGASPLASHLGSLQSAVTMLNNRVRVIKNYLEAVKAGTLKPDHALLRAISALCQQLPAIQTNEFKQAFLVDYNDALLVTYMAAIAKTTYGISDMMEKFNSAHDNRAFRRRGFGQ